MKHLISLAICVLILCGGLAVAYPYVKAMRDGAGEVEVTPTPPKNVEVTVLTPGLVEEELGLTGVIAPWEEVLLSAEVRGTIEWQGVEEGDTVTAGQEVIRVDTTALMTAHEQAKARHSLAAQELKRARDLRARGVGSEQAYDKAVADAEVAEADLRAAEIQLDKSVVHAPFAGVVDQLNREANEFVDPGSPLLHVAQVDRVKAVIAVPERDVLKFSAGDTVRFVLDALEGEELEGTIHRIAATADTQTRTFLFEVELDNAAGRLKPGMTVRATLIRARYENAIAVPLFAIMSVRNQHFAAVEEDGVARLRQVELGRPQDGTIHVRSGLAAGDRLIVSGQRDLRDGAPVNVTAVAGG